MISVVHLQPIIPHYRQEFFELLGKHIKQDIYIFGNNNKANTESFKLSDTKSKRISSVWIGPFLFYNPIKLLKRDYDILVLMLNFTHITTWILLLTKFLHRKKIILWGQGISVKRYLKEEKRVDYKLKWMMSMADGIWLYMEKEEQQWKLIFPNKPMIALKNTLSGVDKMVNYRSFSSKEELKRKYKITQPVILLFCARFNLFRRTDLLLEAIQRLDSIKFGFIIIGAGDSKPNFSSYNNVYDFGAVYETETKKELFSLADIYFQPGWVGLSIVEAMAYGLPIFTFERSRNTLQCVEYSYIKQDKNGMIFKDINECVNIISTISCDSLRKMGHNAREYVRNNLLIEQMVFRAQSVIDKIV